MAKPTSTTNEALGLRHAMPLLVINLGGEMLYVLEQRLGAQQVKTDKSQRVLCDVVKTMFSRRFVEELFKPQFLYKDRNVRQIFDKLAHSSIMKLNETSMGKLYSLMVMGAKFQIVRVSTPCHMLDVTVEHLEQLKKMCASEVTDALLDYCLDSCQTCYGRFTPGDWCLCRQQLLSFFSTRRVRVSIFLQRDLQGQDGTLRLENGGPLTSGALPLTKTHPLARNYHAENRSQHARRLGANMYAEPIPEAKEVPEVKPVAVKEEPAPAKPSTACLELNLLADLVGGDDVPVESFRLALFEDEHEAASPLVDDARRIDARAQRKGVDERFAELGFDDDVKSEAKSEDSDDLLDLMDSIK
mgnify:CR=1 FL=1|jgi:hypothetical protein